MTQCAWCHATIPTGGRGRPRDYCSRSCRAKAYRARHRDNAAAPRPPSDEQTPDNSAGSGTGAAAAALAGADAVAVADAATEPGTQLSLDRIVRAAIALADTEGLEALHMRRLAAYLGAGTMSLYRHVSGRDDLIDHMVALALGEEPQPGTLPVGWRAGLEYTARRDWGLYRRHPWILQYAMVGSRMRWSHNAAADGERALSAFDGLDLSAREQANLLLTVTGFTQGMALIHANDVELTRRTGLTDEQWWNHARHQIPAPDFADDYPRLAHAFGDRPPLTVNLQQRFDEGIKGILDGIGAHLAARTESVGATEATED